MSIQPPARLEQPPSNLVCLRIKPPFLLPWLSATEKRSNVVVLDFEADGEDAHTLRLDLNVAFTPIPVRRGVVTRVDYYVGSTEADIAVTALHGRVINHTPSVPLKVSYSNTTKVDRKTGLRLSPAVTAKAGETEAEVEMGSISRTAGRSASFTAKFENEERQLNALLLGDAVEWSLRFPQTAMVIQDFLQGNLYLFAECNWPIMPRSGSIAIRPDIQFFDHTRRLLGRMQSLAMRCVLWKHGITLQHWDGFSVDFEEVKHERSAG